MHKLRCFLVTSESCSVTRIKSIKFEVNLKIILIRSVRNILTNLRVEFRDLGTTLSNYFTYFPGLMIMICCRFSTKESATHAIVAVHNTDINGQVVKCSWGKESGDPNNAPVSGQSLSGTQYGSFGSYGQQLGYWYPQTYPTAAAAAQIQGQFLQGMQGYTYGQFAGYQQSYMG